MKKPTLEEVKEHFKNAKEVRCLANKIIYSFDEMTDRGIHEDCNRFWVTLKNYKSVLIQRNDEFADIISYKEEPKKDSIVESIINQFSERSKRGIEKYGTTLQENNTDDFFQHLKEELMDAILYIEKLQNMRK